MENRHINDIHSGGGGEWRGEVREILTTLSDHLLYYLETFNYRWYVSNLHTYIIHVSSMYPASAFEKHGKTIYVTFSGHRYLAKLCQLHEFG